MKELISLDEWNQQRRDLHNPQYPRPNGIACPMCGSELHDVDGEPIQSKPPQRKVQCSTCTFNGFRVA